MTAVCWCMSYPGQNPRCPVHRIPPLLPDICRECGNDLALPGYTCCSDCLEGGHDL